MWDLWFACCVQLTQPCLEHSISLLRIRETNICRCVNVRNSTADCGPTTARWDFEPRGGELCSFRPRDRFQLGKSCRTRRSRASVAQFLLSSRSATSFDPSRGLPTLDGLQLNIMLGMLARYSASMSCLRQWTWPVRATAPRAGRRHADA